MKRFQQQPAIWSSWPIGEIQRLTGAVKNTWRPRVGDWRVFYTYRRID